MANFLSALGKSGVGTSLYQMRMDEEKAQMDRENNALNQQRTQGLIQGTDIANQEAEMKLRQAQEAEQDAKMPRDISYYTFGMGENEKKFISDLVQKSPYAKIDPAMGSVNISKKNMAKLQSEYKQNTELNIFGISNSLMDDQSRLAEIEGKFQKAKPEEQESMKQQWEELHKKIATKRARIVQLKSMTDPSIMKEQMGNEAALEAQRNKPKPQPNTIIEMQMAINDPNTPSELKVQYQNTLEAIKEFELKKSKAGASSTNVSITNKQETEEAKQVGQDLGKMYIDMQKAGLSAVDAKQAYVKFEELLKGVNTGKLTPAYKTVVQYGRSMGIDIGNKELPALEAMNAISNQLAMKMRNPESGFGLTGQTSDRDVQFLKDAVVGIEKTPGGNQILIDWAKKIADRKVHVAQMAREWRKKNGTIEGFDGYLREWTNQNSLFPEAGNVNSPTRGRFQVREIR